MPHDARSLALGTTASFGQITDEFEPVRGVFDSLLAADGDAQTLAAFVGVALFTLAAATAVIIAAGPRLAPRHRCRSTSAVTS